MTQERLSDEQLVMLVQLGHQEALADLYDRYARPVHGLAYHMLQDAAQAEEVTQDVFVNLWLKASSFQSGRGKVSSWLLTMAHHRAIDQLRQRRREWNAQGAMEQQAVIDQDTHQESPAEHAQQTEEAMEVRKALKGLPPEQHQVVLLAYYQGLTQSEIAQRLQQPLGTVKTRMRLAMQKLRAALNPSGVAHEL